MTNNKLKEIHITKQNNECADCKKDLTELGQWGIRLDRIIPGKDKGKYIEENTRVICVDCDWKKEGNAPDSPKPHLRSAYERYKMFNQMKGDMERRVKAYSGQMKDTSKNAYIDPTDLLFIIGMLEEEEKKAKKEVCTLVKEEPEWKGFMKGAPGMGELNAALLLSRIDISKSKHISSLWKFFGYDPTEKYNPGKGKLKAKLYAGLSISLIRKEKKDEKTGEITQKASPYRAMYDDYYSRKSNKDPEKTIGDGGAKCRTIKMWLSHCWATWRAFARLTVSKPYMHQNDDDYKKAVDYGWAKIESHEIQETHDLEASHVGEETHRDEASQNDEETQSLKADLIKKMAKKEIESQRKEVTRNGEANHIE